MSKEGDELFKKAEESLTKFRLFSNDQKWIEAAELFQNSGKSYESSQDWIHAGESYSRASDCFQEDNKLDEAAETSSKAGRMFLKQPETAQRAYESFLLASRFYRENSKPTVAFQFLRETAKLFIDQKYIEKAIQIYKDAAQIMDDEDRPSQATEQLETAANVCCQHKKWLEASNLYKNIAHRKSDKKFKGVAPFEFYVKAVVCRIAGEDLVGAEKLMNEFSSEIRGWEKTSECSLLMGLDKAVDERDVDEFERVVEEYESHNRVDEWLANALDEMKSLISEIQ